MAVANLAPTRTFMRRSAPTFDKSTFFKSIADGTIARKSGDLQMLTSLRPLTTGQLLDRTFQTYRQNFILFAGISAVPHACLLVMQLGLLAAGGGSTGGSPGKLALLTFIVSIFTLIVALVVSSIATAATTFGVSDVYLEKQTSISACFARVKGKIGKVIFASFELGLRIGVGFMLLIFPGIYWAGKYGLAVPAVVLEDIKGKQACGRSAELTKDSVGRIVAIYFLTWILVVAISAGIGAVLGVAAPSLTRAAGTTGSKVFQYLLSSVVNTLVTPVMAIALTLAYYDQRVRKEAFDIESMMSLLGEPTAAIAEITMRPAL
jgi:hypothetical protein